MGICGGCIYSVSSSDRLPVASSATEAPWASQNLTVFFFALTSPADLALLIPFTFAFPALSFALSALAPRLRASRALTGCPRSSISLRFRSCDLLIAFFLPIGSFAPPGPLVESDLPPFSFFLSNLDRIGPEHRVAPGQHRPQRTGAYTVWRTARVFIAGRLGLLSQRRRVDGVLKMEADGAERVFVETRVLQHAGKLGHLCREKLLAGLVAQRFAAFGRGSACLEVR